MMQPSRPVRRNSGSTKTGVGLPSTNRYGLAWKIVSVCLGNAQNPPDNEGESTQISPTVKGGQRRFVSGSTSAKVASGNGYPNAPARIVPGSLALFLTSSPRARTTTSLVFKLSLSSSTSLKSVDSLFLARFLSLLAPLSKLV